MSKCQPTHTLIHPIEFAGETITKLTFRKPLGKDILDMELKEVQTVGDLIRLAARLTETVPTAFEVMEPEDIMAVVEITADQLGGGPTTGGSS